MHLSTLVKMALLCMTFATEACAENYTVETTPVAAFDVNRYLGKWYEIARFDHRFERGLVGCSANYWLRPDGKIRVVNSGYKDSLQGKLKVAVGKARQPDPGRPGHLEVAFFLWFYGDYNIFFIDSEYRYVLVGSGNDRYLWILSRTPQLPPGAKEILLNEIARRGFHADRLIWVAQPISE